MYTKALQYLYQMYKSIQKFIKKYLPKRKKRRRIVRRKQLAQRNAAKRQSQELFRLICYQYRYEKIKSLPKNTDRFLGISWKNWKAKKWISIICHPQFLHSQYSPEFLEKLCWFLQKESQNHPEGIQQDLYFALCIAYGFFLDENEKSSVSADNQENAAIVPEGTAVPKEGAIKAIETLLARHPKHQEYVQDIQCWSDVIEERHFFSFCREAYSFSQNKGKKEQQAAFARVFLDTAEQWLLMSTLSDVSFALHNLCRLDSPLFSQQLAAKIQECRRLDAMQGGFFQAFTEALDHNQEGHSVHEYGYIPHMQRFSALKKQYNHGGSWEKLLRSRNFQQRFREWVMHPCYKGYVSSYPRYLEYYSWREVRSQFQGNSPIEEELSDWLRTSLYFTEYEKRFQKEQLWREQQIEKAYFEEIFPLPARSEQKQEALNKVEQGKPINAEKASAVLSELYAHNETAVRLLMRATNIMVHFNFLLSRSKDKKNIVCEDMVCFLEDEVLIYCQKENGTCHLSHAAFFDLISHIVDSKADCHLTHKKSFYNEEFIESVCKNMYFYECFIRTNNTNNPHEIP